MTRADRRSSEGGCGRWRRLAARACWGIAAGLLAAAAVSCWWTVELVNSGEARLWMRGGSVYGFFDRSDDELAQRMRSTRRLSLTEPFFDLKLWDWTARRLPSPPAGRGSMYGFAAPGWVLPLALAAAGGRLYWPLWRAGHDRARGLCAACRYPRAGLAAAACPECGVAARAVTEG